MSYVEEIRELIESSDRETAKAAEQSKLHLERAAERYLAAGQQMIKWQEEEMAQGRKLTVREIAKQCGISKSRVSEYMQMAGGKKTPKDVRTSKRTSVRKSRSGLSTTSRRRSGQRRGKGKQAKSDPPEPKPLPPEEYRSFLIAALARAFEAVDFLESYIEEYVIAAKPVDLPEFIQKLDELGSRYSAVARQLKKPQLRIVAAE